MTFQEKVDKLIKLLNENRTVYIQTIYRTIVVTKKTFDKFNNLNIELFKADNTGFYIRNGKRYDCLNGCKISHT
ncbi:MAG: hypothetical protein WC679_01015 [Bacteroidales bacterium]|jgi:hypothetical protein